MATWDEDYPNGYECCASGSCEVCGGAQGIARQAVKEDAAVRAQRRRGLCSCRTGYANNPGVHNNQVRAYGRCYCECHGSRR